MWYRQRTAELVAVAERLKDDQRLMLLEIAARYYRAASELEQEKNELPPGEIKRQLRKCTSARSGRIWAP